MQSNKLAGNKIRQSTQQYLDIAEIRNDCVIMKDGTLRMVLMVASINFALKSEEEQNAIISAYMQFLNSFDFPIQVIIQSRKLNIDDYLKRLDEEHKKQNNDLLKMQIIDYKEFITELVEMSDIMNKSFYIVVPYSPLSNKQKGFWVRLTELFSPARAVSLNEERFLDRRREILQRVDHVAGSLESMSLKSHLLDTQGLIELYYNSYNLDIAEQEPLADLSKLNVEK